MPENQSKGNGNKNPWGTGPEQKPPDLIDLIKKFFGQSHGNKSENNNPDPVAAKVEYLMRYIWVVGILLIIIWGLAGIFLVSPVEEAVILRFGKYVSTLGPGLHWVPPLIESNHNVDVQQVRNFPYQAEMLTKDENIVFVSLAVQYRIDNPRDYLFNVVDPEQTIQQATSSALRQVVGTMTLDSVLTTGRQELRDRVALELKKTIAAYQIGYEITDVNLQPAKPPEPVTAAFDDAIKAREDEQRFINQAKAYDRRVVSIAQGQVSRLLQSAEAYQKEVVLQAEGQTARYLAILKPYQHAPQITQERLYLDTVSKVLSRTTNILVDTNGNNVLYLPLDQILRHQMRMYKSQDNSRTNTTPTKADSANTEAHLELLYEKTRPSYPIGGGNE